MNNGKVWRPKLNSSELSYKSRIKMNFWPIFFYNLSNIMSDAEPRNSIVHHHYIFTWSVAVFEVNLLIYDNIVLLGSFIDGYITSSESFWRLQEGEIEPNLCPSRWSLVVHGVLLEPMMGTQRSVPHLLHHVIIWTSKSKDVVLEVNFIHIFILVFPKCFLHWFPWLLYYSWWSKFHLLFLL